jgi:antirestriction protein ArdC
MSYEKTDKFQLITDKLIALIEQGVKPWQKPWHSTPYQNLITGHAYRGFNPVLIAIDCMANQYNEPFFVGFHQAQQYNWKIKKGAKSTWIRWGGTGKKQVIDPETQETKEEVYQAIKWQNVFHCSYIDDSEGTVSVSKTIAQVTPQIKNNEAPRKESAETLIARHNPNTFFGSNVACYSSKLDRISMPNYEHFSSREAYYGTYLHELTHWTGHQSRCNRPLGNSFGSAAYAFEELIAEIGAAIVTNQIGIDSQLENHASYLSCWLA